MKGSADLIRLLRDGKTFWLASHILIDGDGLGSLLGLALALRKAGKVVEAINQPPLPRHLAFLPGYETVSSSEPEGVPDAVIALDAPDLERLGVVRKWIPGGVPIVNLDHHVSNGRFGTIDIVEPDLSSTGEIVYRILREGGFPLDGEIARCLLTAIYTDTGRFSYSNTSPETLEISADLLRLGAGIREVSKGAYESRTRAELNLQALVIEHVAVDEGGEIAWSHLRLEDLAKAGSRPLDGNDLVEIPRSLGGVRIAVFFREIEGAVRVSLRSEGEVDVAAIATEYGGGGHRNSAGCVVKRSLEETMEAVLERAREALRG